MARKEGLVDECETLADVMDDARIELWMSLEKYRIGMRYNLEEVVDDAIGSLNMQKHKMDRILFEALALLKQHPNYSQLESRARKAVEDTKKEIDVIIEMMRGRKDPEEILEYQMDNFEHRQFKRQHELYFDCRSTLSKSSSQSSSSQSVQEGDTIYALIEAVGEIKKSLAKYAIVYPDKDCIKTIVDDLIHTKDHKIDELFKEDMRDIKEIIKNQIDMIVGLMNSGVDPMYIYEVEKRATMDIVAKFSETIKFKGGGWWW